MVWPFRSAGPSGFSAYSTAEEVTDGIDGRGLTAVLTGGTNGIGRETARVLALRGVHVVIGARDASSGRRVKDELLEQMPEAKIDVLELDLSSMASVRRFASVFKSMNLPLNILINNAATLPSDFKLSADGIEVQFATNHVGHFLLTNLLLDKMRDTSTTRNIEGRIINVSSLSHTWANKGILFDELNDERKYNYIKTYGQSKLANILHANELARYFEEEELKITANSLHPGAIITSIFRDHPFINAAWSFIGKIIGKNMQQGAATTCYLALHPQLVGISGKYFDNCNVAKPSSHAMDEELGKKLWDFSMGLVLNGGKASTDGE